MLRKRLGSSPRVWGQGLTPHTLGSVVPIIPTRVGTRLLLSFLSSSGTYHPHACGDKIRRLNIVKMHQVSSPRVWGQGLSALGFRLFLGIIPTRVGTSYTTGFLICQGGGSVDYNIKCNTKKSGHHTHFRVKCNYHKTKDTEVEYEVLYTFYTI